MPTQTPPRTLGRRAGATALTAVFAAGAAWFGAPSALAAPGDGGDIRIHEVGVPFGVSKDDPRVCRFYLDAVNFDSLTSISYTIQPQPPLPNTAETSGTIALAGGAGHTDPLGLADGQYTLTWTVPGETAPPTPQPGTTRQKVFRVDCHHREDRDIRDRDRDRDSAVAGRGRDRDPVASDRDRDPGQAPRGGVHAGGGGLADTAGALSPVAGAAGVGLVAAAGVVYFRVTRRRPDGAA
ncbi:hypothetical protein ACFOOM_26755 [Streptomyces echinoruber]|uniref:CopC domain-containing protein n=1 Tax=Streptomyces echinoruber TaxID=68898 RepID=A0A918RD72_9ACTN|nr:hypothetical protein [Streptomyces echinoruber]GGZ92759.1 hypothetical protein GCM10010389_34100 [Streptomyces echinoruber]